MTAPPGYGENRGTLCVSPQKGTAGGAGAWNARRAAAARPALAPICRFHQRVALRSLHGLRNALPVPARQKSFLAGRARFAVDLPFLGRRPPTRHPPRRGLLTGVGTLNVAETESSSISKAQSRLLPGNGGVWGRESGRGYPSERPRLAPRPLLAPTTMSSTGVIFRSIV